MEKLKELSEHYLTDNSQRIGGTIAKPHKPTLEPSFAKEPPSQRTKKLQNEQTNQ